MVITAATMNETGSNVKCLKCSDWNTLNINNALPETRVAITAGGETETEKHNHGDLNRQDGCQEENSRRGAEGVYTAHNVVQRVFAYC